MANNSGFGAGLRAPKALVLAVGLCLAASGASGAELQLGGSGATLGTMRLLADAYTARHPETTFVVLPSMGSSGGIKAALAGAVALGLSTRALKPAEIAAGAEAIEYGRTPFIFATAKSTPVDGISTRQLADIYAGRLTEWPGGHRIRMILRPISDSDNDAIKAISPEVREGLEIAEKRPGMAFAVTDQETAKAIETTPGGIGPSTLALILSENRDLKALKLDGIAPAPASLADGSYALDKPMLAVRTPKTPPAALDFLAFIRSDEGRAILARTGHLTR